MIRLVASLFKPMRNKTNRDLLARIISHLVTVSRSCFEFWLVHCAVYVCSDWLECRLLWVWFDGTQLKPALSRKEYEFYKIAWEWQKGLQKQTKLYCFSDQNHYYDTLHFQVVLKIVLKEYRSQFVYLDSLGFLCSRVGCSFISLYNLQVMNTMNTPLILRTVPIFVTVHTFCVSRDTRVSYGWCLLIQGYFCAV